MATPDWLAATAGVTALPGQVNQFLGQHSSAWLQGGTVRSAQTIGSAVFQSTQTQYLAQEFTTDVSQTDIGQIWLQISTVGGSPVTATINPLVVALYANSGSTPSGAAIASTTLNEQYVYTAPFWLPVPMAVTGVAPSTTYQIVVSLAGTASHYYVWQQSNQVSGASTSPDGITWTSQAYGFMYQVYDQSAASYGNVRFIYDDFGARWAQLGYDTANKVSAVTEYVNAQSPGAPLQSARTFAYTDGFLTGVS